MFFYILKIERSEDLGMSNGANIFLNNNFRVLKIIADNQANFQGEMFCPLSQEEISSLSGINRVTVNGAINLMKKEGFILNVSKSRHYQLSESGNKFYRIISKF